MWSRSLCGGVVAALITGVPAVAQAHFGLVAPPPRLPDSSLGPCGTGTPSGERTTFLPGETISVQWAQQIPHNGFYFVRFSPNDDAGYADHELLMTDEVNGQIDYTFEVTLPECSCDDCTLQVWQATPSLEGGYYQCADIELVANDPLAVSPCPMAMVEPGEGSSSGGDADDSGDGGAPSDDGGTTGGAPSDDGVADTSGTLPPWAGTGTGEADEGSGSDGAPSSSDSDGGCAVARPSAPRDAGGWLAWGAVVLVATRGRRRDHG